MGIQVAADEHKQPTLTMGKQDVLTAQKKEQVHNNVTPLLALWPHPAAQPEYWSPPPPAAPSA